MRGWGRGSGWNPCEELGCGKNFTSTTMYTWHGDEGLNLSNRGVVILGSLACLSCSLWRE